MPHQIIFFTGLLGVFALTAIGCGETRREGDVDGIPVRFVVRTDREFFSRMADHRTSVSTGLGVGFGSGGGVGTGLGLGLGFHSTTAYLLGGSQPGEAGSFRRELSWGETTFTIPLSRGRIVNLTAQAEGGRQGWESIGTFTVAETTADDVEVVLDVTGAHLTVH